MAGRILAAVSIGIVTLLLVQNGGNVSITFMIWRFDIPTDAMIVFSWLAGMLNGALYTSLRTSRRSGRDRTP
jgi:uncharacterized integral membrane protein